MMMAAGPPQDCLPAPTAKGSTSPGTLSLAARLGGCPQPNERVLSSSGLQPAAAALPAASGAVQAIGFLFSLSLGWGVAPGQG